VIALTLREFHQFEAAGRRFLYLVPSAAVFELEEPGQAILDLLDDATVSEDDVVNGLSARFPVTVIRETIADLLNARAIGYEHVRDDPGPKQLPMVPFPLNTIVLNVTNQCNLACTYCYEYGEDKIVDTEHGQQSKFMSETTAREAVDLLLRESGRVAHMTFFGGETLLNFPVLKSTIAYARERAAQVYDPGGAIDRVLCVL